MNNKKMMCSIECKAFEAFKADFDYVLNRTLSNMKKNENDESVLTVKVKISLEDEALPNRGDKVITKPKFEHKVSSTLHTKCERKGVQYGEYELVYDDESGDYVVCDFDSGQLSLM